MIANDPVAHFFAPGLAYSYCRSKGWFDWGTPRHRLPQATPCEHCVAEIEFLKVRLVEALDQTWWTFERSELEERLADVERHLGAAARAR